MRLSWASRTVRPRARKISVPKVDIAIFSPFDFVPSCRIRSHTVHCCACILAARRMPQLCVDCEKLTIDTLRDQEVPLKENLAALIDSARNGCTFCSMCWTQFQKDCTSDTIQRHLRGDFGPIEKSADWRIYLNAELHENGGWYSSNSKGSHVQISSGRFPHYENEPGTGTTLYTHLSVFADPGMT
jgi:hypothetical protein